MLLFDLHPPMRAAHEWGSRPKGGNAGGIVADPGLKPVDLVGPLPRAKARC